MGVGASPDVRQRPYTINSIFPDSSHRFAWTTSVGYASVQFSSLRLEPMRRRTFLRSAATVVPALGLHNLVLSQEATEKPTQPTSADLHIVKAGSDRFEHPHAMGFSSMLFKVMPGETGGGLFVVEHKNLTPGGPVLHLHLKQEEWFYVMEGQIEFQVGEQRFTLHPGESVLAPRLVPHTFSSVGSTPGHMLIAFTPAGKMEQYFRDTADAHLAAPDPSEYLSHYDMKYVGPSPLRKS
jgi:mannose-6-phosphate isomerase-like protein (cupin superfamily)